MKFTVMLTDEGTQRITGGVGAFPPNCAAPEGKLCEDEEMAGFFNATGIVFVRSTCKTC